MTPSRFLLALLATVLALPSHAVAAAAAQHRAWVDPLLRDHAEGPLPVLVGLAAAPPLRTADALPRAPFAQRITMTVAHLRSHAAHSQGELLAQLRARGIPHRAWWVANAIRVEATAAQRDWLAGRHEVEVLVADRRIAMQPPRPAAAEFRAAGAVEWGVAMVRAPELWALGHRGQGIVIGGQDTGYDWQHPALRAAYRGWNGSSASHDHNWHDAISAGAPNPCGLSAPAPCDDSGHGTHTMGTALGDDGGANAIGVAPAARWIGCRNMNSGDGTASTYLDCLQWFLAPTDVGGGDPRPELAPHIINNSWACPPSEGCTDVQILSQAVANVHAAGILVVSSAGNSGPGCSTVSTPLAIYEKVFSVGAVDSAEAIAGFSSRGPAADDSARPKPDAVAPGVAVRSALPGGAYGNYSGTSMAAPHVAGVAALLMSADPTLVGDPDRVASLLRATAVPRTAAQSCGTMPGSAIPNAVYGHGRIDALAALLEGAVLFADGFEAAAPKR